ncbi:MAG TPA: LacI family DNA-binding transcriptional regulator [Anaerolineales bacterium]|nr:LacI family DNA-binding transcriptional regulator [Anaerolineales bacterium]
MTNVSSRAQPDQKSSRHLHATLRDVADYAGVSIKTVSRVVNHQNEISEETRQRVQAAIDKLGYQPNILARSLIHQRSKTLGVLAWGLDYYGPSRTVVGIEQEANELGYSLFLCLVNHPTDDHQQILNTLISRRVEGIIWAIPEVGDNRKWIQTNHLDRLPPVVFLSMAARPGISVVSVDNRNGAKQAVRHLYEQGKRRIGIITGPMAWWEAQERYAGWQEAMQELGLEACQALVVTSDDWSAVNGERGMRTLLDQSPDVDAVFASSDQIALGAMGIAHRLGRRLPQELAIVGFDNTPEAAFFWPPLTTMYQQLIDVGRIAVQNLHEMIQARQSQNVPYPPSSTMLKPELIIRASSSA